MGNEAVGTVHIKRLTIFQTIAEGWQLFIDGETAALLGPGDDIELLVYPGLHRLEVSGARKTKGTSLDFTIAAGQRAEIYTWPSNLMGFSASVLIALRSPDKLFGRPPEPGAR